MGNDSKSLRDVVLAELARGTHTEAFADGARWAVQEAERLTASTADVSAKVIREHEPRHWGCSCGAPMGDGIDYRWHLVNQSIAAARDVEWVVKS